MPCSLKPAQGWQPSLGWAPPLPRMRVGSWGHFLPAIFSLCSWNLGARETGPVHARQCLFEASDLQWFLPHRKPRPPPSQGPLSNRTPWGGGGPGPGPVFWTLWVRSKPAWGSAAELSRVRAQMGPRGSISSMQSRTSGQGRLAQSK